VREESVQQDSVAVDTIAHDSALIGQMQIVLSDIDSIKIQIGLMIKNVKKDSIK